MKINYCYNDSYLDSNPVWCFKPVRATFGHAMLPERYHTDADQLLGVDEREPREQRVSLALQRFIRLVVVMLT